MTESQIRALNQMTKGGSFTAKLSSMVVTLRRDGEHFVLQMPDNDIPIHCDTELSSYTKPYLHYLYNEWKDTIQVIHELD